MEATTEKKNPRQLSLKPVCNVKLDKREPNKTLTPPKILEDPTRKNDWIFPVRVCATYRFDDGEGTKPYSVQKWYGLKYFCSPNDWAKIEKGTRLTPLQSAVSKAKKEADAKVLAILETRTVVKLQQFEELFLSEQLTNLRDLNTIDAVFNIMISEIENDSNIGSAKIHRYALKTFLDFSPGVTWVEISKDWVKRYVAWMKENERSDTYIAINLRQLRLAFNRAIDDGVVKADLYPFGKRGYKIKKVKKTEKDKIALAHELKMKVLEFKSGNESAQFGADFWKLSYYWCGLNIADIALLKNKELDNGTLRRIREKTKNRTGKKLVLPMDAYINEIREIIHRYGSKSLNPDDYVFPFVEGVKGETKKEKAKELFRLRGNFLARVNRGLKRAKKALELPVNSLTSYTARHTFAHDFLRSGGSLEELQVLLGHATILTTHEYTEDWLDRDQKVEALDRLKNMNVSRGAK